VSLFIPSHTNRVKSTASGLGLGYIWRCAVLLFVQVTPTESGLDLGDIKRGSQSVLSYHFHSLFPLMPKHSKKSSYRSARATPAPTRSKASTTKKSAANEPSPTPTSPDASDFASSVMAIDQETVTEAIESGSEDDANPQKELGKV
jgi:hypothetical protein